MNPDTIESGIIRERLAMRLQHRGASRLLRVSRILRAREILALSDKQLLQETAEKKLAGKPSVARFIIPLGATINMEPRSGQNRRVENTAAWLRNLQTRRHPAPAVKPLS
jgi:hypothetical protein